MTISDEPKTVYASIAFEGDQALICELCEVEDWLKDAVENGDLSWTVTPVQLTDEEYANLPEYQS